MQIVRQLLKMQKIISLGLALSLIGVAESYATAEPPSSNDKHSANLAAATDAGCKLEGTSYTGQSGKQVLFCFERNSLSKDARVLVKLVCLQSGGIACTEVQRRPGPEGPASASDAFYCEQALWENAPCASIPCPEHSQCEFEAGSDKGNSFNCAKLFFSAHPNLQGETVVMHIIPPSVSWRYPGLFSDEEIHGLNNLAAIPITNVDSKLLLGVREEWIDFFKTRTKPTRGQVISSAQNIVTMYPKLFMGLAIGMPSLNRWRKKEAEK
jgi:hypothetical protein